MASNRRKGNRESKPEEVSGERRRPPYSGGGSLRVPPTTSRPTQAFFRTPDNRYTFAGPRSGLAIYADVPQWVSHQFDFTCRGLWRPNAAIANASFFGETESFWDELYVQLVLQTEGNMGYRHTPALLTDNSAITRYINDYVKCVINTRMLLNCFGMDGFNTSTYQVIRALRLPGGYRGRLQSIHETLASIPMPDYFRRLAVMWGAPRYAMDYGFVLAWIMTWDTAYSQRIGNWTPAFNPIAAAAEDSIFDFTDGANGDDIDDIIVDTENALENLLGLGTATAAFQTDARAVRDLFEMLRYPKGLPPLEGLIQDPAFMDHIMFREALELVDTNVGAAVTYLWYPNLTLPGAGQQEVQLVRRGMGTPSPYLLAGLCIPYGHAATGSTGTVGESGQIASAAGIDFAIFGGFRFSVGGVGNYTNGATNPGRARFARIDTPEDDSGITGLVYDGASAAAILGTVVAGIPMTRHQFFTMLVAAGQLAEDYRLLLDTVNWEFLQPFSTIPQIYRTQLAEAFGLPIG